jgi:hypothetical protein
MKLQFLLNILTVIVIVFSFVLGVNEYLPKYYKNLHLSDGNIYYAMQYFFIGILLAVGLFIKRLRGKWTNLFLSLVIILAFIQQLSIFNLNKWFIFKLDYTLQEPALIWEFPFSLLTIIFNVFNLLTIFILLFYQIFISFREKEFVEK